MASTLIDVKVTGLKELENNLREFVGPRDLGRIIRNALQAGARLPRASAARIARNVGMGFIGLKEVPFSRRTYKRYGRIPKSFKVNRAYTPRGAAKDSMYRVNVVARTNPGSRTGVQRGVYPNRAPHAHLIEYGWQMRGGRRMPGRPMLGKALDETAAQVVPNVAANMSRAIDRLKFKTTGKP